jgi:hypothetical protein
VHFSGLKILTLERKRCIRALFHLVHPLASLVITIRERHGKLLSGPKLGIETGLGTLSDKASIDTFDDTSVPPWTAIVINQRVHIPHAASPTNY